MLQTLVILCVLAIGAASKPHDTGGNNNDVPNKQQPAPTKTYPYNADCCTKQATTKADNEAWKWYTPLKNPDWWLVFVAAVTGALIASQAWETRKAAVATSESVRLQEAAYEQWLTLDNWSNVMEDHVRATSPVYARINHLIVCVSAVNRSAYPLTILDGKFVFMCGDVDYTYPVSQNVFLVPSDVVEIKAQITHRGEEFQDYVKGIYTCYMSGFIRYKSVIGKITTQEFGGIVRPRLNGTDFEPHGLLHPSRRNQLADQPAEDK